jgi:hypothetical protein
LDHRVDRISPELTRVRSAPGAPRRGARWAGLLLLACAACASPPAAAPLANTFGTPHALADAVLDGFARRDETTLRGLALSAAEFREHVWPELPAARPERNLPPDYVWGDLQQKSDASLRSLLAQHGGRRLTLESVSFAGETTGHQTYTVARKATLRVRDGQGTSSTIRLFGSVLQKDGRAKVFSYIVD